MKFIDNLFKKETNRQLKISQELLVVQELHHALKNRLNYLTNDPEGKTEKINRYLELISENMKEQQELVDEYRREA